MYHIIYAVLAIMISENFMADSNLTLVSSSFNNNDGTLYKLVSRRKRFLIFPEGSSVQLVFCNQHHGYLKIGDIVWFGTTAALAWELPTDPKVYDMFRDQNKIYEANRRNDVIYYLDEDGKVIGSKEYVRKSIINPAFAKRSVGAKMNKRAKITKLSIQELHKMQTDNCFTDELDAKRIEYLKIERLTLYHKIEQVLNTYGWSGKDCIRQMLCWTSQSTKQRTFLEEIFKAIFTLPKVQSRSDVHNPYDDAQETNEDCADLYPKCGHVL